jgi:catechol 2,3-dioxygenase-like lactoylglutathione lyase family enzyme
VTETDDPQRSAWATGIAAVTLFVEDLAAAKDFYVTAFEAAVRFEDADSVVFAFGDTLVNLLRTSAAPEVIAPAVVAAHDAGSRSLHTVDVADVDEIAARLVARGVTLLNGPVDRPWGVRTACFGDPAGHLWEIAQPI